MIRILIADDHAIVRAELKQLLALVDDLQVSAEASSGEQVLALLQGARVDLVLLDMSMPGPSGVELIGRIRAQYGALPVLVFSVRNEVQVARSAFKAGASGYLTKDNEPEVLIAAIRQTVAGQRCIDALLVDQLGFGPAGADPAGT